MDIGAKKKPSCETEKTNEFPFCTERKKRLKNSTLWVQEGGLLGIHLKEYQERKPRPQRQAEKQVRRHPSCFCPTFCWTFSLSKTCRNRAQRWQCGFAQGRRGGGFCLVWKHIFTSSQSFIVLLLASEEHILDMNFSVGVALEINLSPRHRWSGTALRYTQEDGAGGSRQKGSRSVGRSGLSMGCCWGSTVQVFGAPNLPWHGVLSRGWSRQAVGRKGTWHQSLTGPWLHSGDIFLQNFHSSTAYSTLPSSTCDFSPTISFNDGGYAIYIAVQSAKYCNQAERPSALLKQKSCNTSKV